MSTSSHPQHCRCRVHTQLAARRHECYRQLAMTILGPTAPNEDVALAHALADHAARLRPAAKVAAVGPRRAA